MSKKPQTGTFNINGESWSVTLARYTKNKVAVHTVAVGMYKSRVARLAEAFGGHYSDRERAYIMSYPAAEKLKQAVEKRLDATVFGAVVGPSGEES